jgi:hypothetical protein
MNTRKILTTLALLVSAVAARAQAFSIDWSSLDGGGGGTSAGGLYSLSGTIGQADANQEPMIGGPFSLAGGFWSIFAVQTAGAPRLTITSNPQLLTSTISWPSSAAGFTLRQNTDLTTTNWVPVSQSVTDNGTIRSVTISSRAGRNFYRLFKP